MKCLIPLCLLTLCLSACGFHLRGSQSYPAELKNLHVTSYQPYFALTKTLKRQLLTRGIHIQHARSNYTLHVKHANSSQRLTSVSSNSQVRQYSLTFTVEYELLDKQNKALLPPQMVSVQQMLTLNSNAILGSESEQTTIQQELNEQVATRIIDRLSSAEVKKALHHETKS